MGSRCPPSDAPSRTASKEHFNHLLTADGTDQLAQRAIDEEQHYEPELGRPEVGPDDLAHQLTVRRTQAPGTPPERHEVFQVVDEQRRDHIDHRLPYDIVHQRLVWEAINER